MCQTVRLHGNAFIPPLHFLSSLLLSFFLSFLSFFLPLPVHSYECCQHEFDYAHIDCIFRKEWIMHGEGKKMRKEKIEGNGEKVKEKKEKEA